MTHQNIRRGALVLPAVLALFLLAGCGGNDDAETTAAETTVENAAEEVAATLTEAEEALVAKAAAIAAAVEKAPAMAEAILKEKGVSTEEYEAMIYEIAGDPKLSDAFEKAKAGL